MVVIIESPGKKKKIEKYTGAKVIPTVGHIKDLPTKELGVDLETFEGNFIPKDPSRKKNLKYIKDMCKNEDVYIATDGDREGDAIGAMVYMEIKDVCKKCYRVVFGEITEKVVKEEINNAIPFEQFNWNSYKSFLGRRIGDRLVGYLLSNIAHNGSKWDNEKDRMSVGRVQTISIKAIVERHFEIENFKPEPFWNITAKSTKNNIEFKLNHENNKFKDENLVTSIFEKIKNETIGIVKNIETKESKTKPKAPYITSTIQAHASSVLGLSGKQTMSLLQKMFEAGHITYHRTDSAAISQEYSLLIGDFLKEKYSEYYSGIRTYKSKNSQAEAHECIRPTVSPFEYYNIAEQIYTLLEEVKVGLGKKAKSLYLMICSRILSSQLNDAIYDRTIVEIEIKDQIFKTNGRVLKHKGFLAIKNAKEEDDKEEKAEDLPNLEIGEKLNIYDLKNDKGFTEPPTPYTEPSLIKKLEKEGIGRPSTYASIIDILFNKNYAKKEKKYIIPQKKAFVLIEFMEKEYPFLIDYKFTAQLEEQLDLVAEGKLNWKDAMQHLYEQMGRPVPQKRGVSTKMLDLAKKISNEKNIPIDENKKNDLEYIKNFIETNMSFKPSEKQISFAKSLSEKTGIELSEEILNNYKKLSKWIDKAKKNVVYPLSEKQKSIIEKNGDNDILSIINSNNPNDLKKLHDWLKNFFKK